MTENVCSGNVYKRIHLGHQNGRRPKIVEILHYLKLNVLYLGTQNTHRIVDKGRPIFHACNKILRTGKVPKYFCI